MAVAGPPAAGFGASASLFALGLVTALLCLFLLLLQAGYRYSIGALLQVLAGLLDEVTIHAGRFHIGHPLGWLARQVRILDSGIKGWIGWGIAQTEHGTSMLFHGSAEIFHWTTDELQKMGGAAYGALAWFKHVELPAVRHYAGHVARVATDTAHHDAVRVARAATAPLYPKLNSLDRFWRHQMDVFARGIDSLAHRLTGQLVKAVHALRSAVARAHAEARTIRGVTVKQARRLARLERAIAGAGAATLAGLRRRVGKLERDVAGIKAGTGVKIGVGALTVALEAAGLGWLRCRNVSTIGKGACRLDPSMLEEILADTLLIAGTLSLVEFAETMVGVTDEASGLIARFWRVT